MVKLPEKAPDWKNIIKRDFKKIFKCWNDPDIQMLIEKTDRLYYYWDKIRVQPLTAELDRADVWAFIRLRRQMNSAPTPIQDINGHVFTFWLPDDIQKKLHLIDQSTGGNLALWDPGNDKRASAKYIVSSLMEEAITSSQIEGAVATIKEAKKMLLEKRKPRNKSEQMIYNNFVTMQSIKDACKKKLDMKMLMDLHVSITKGTLESVEDEGRLRNDDDNVSVVTTYGELLFSPPKSAEIPNRLEALFDFANDGDDKPFIHPVIKAIMLHFWMAYIHPFTDGNGRMARTLFYWYMLRHGYWLFEYTSISKTILKRTTKYANAYLYSEHDDNDLTYFIHFHIDVIMGAVEDLKKHIQAEREKNHQLHLEIAEHPDLNIRQTRIIQHIMSHPHDILTIKIHQNLNKIAYQTARTDLFQLEEKKLLKLVKKGKVFYFVPADDLWERIEKAK
ncbi:MAG: Fic family protein [Chlamydiales bacterium]|nr:Fic family protein [Chlamydiales bacterium]